MKLPRPCNGEVAIFAKAQNVPSVYFFAVHEPSGQDYPEQKHLFYSMN
jgi:hypothetical protein